VCPDGQVDHSELSPARIGAAVAHNIILRSYPPREHLCCGRATAEQPAADGLDNRGRCRPKRRARGAV